MKKVSMLEFRHDAERIIEKVRNGQRMILTYRGKAVLRLEPIGDDSVDEQDSFYELDRLADSRGRTLSNRQMDKIIYGT